MSIRAATNDDVNGICRVAELAWETDYPDILTRETAEESVTDWYAPERLEGELEQDRTTILVAERDETVVGFVHATWSEDEPAGYILRLYVHPEHRRENVGRELLERVCASLAEAGVDRINAMVLAENRPGNAFYERFGFELEDEQQTTIGDESYPENRYVLERPFDVASG